VVASVEGVEKIFTRNQSNALLWSQNVTDARRLDIWASMCSSQINFGDYNNDVQTTIEDTGGSISNVV
jgi:hypothetical protein